MQLPTRPVATAAAAAVSGALLLRHELKERQTAERVAGAALESLLKAIDANDPQTGVHVRRVASYALVLADAADLDEHVRHAIERVALFHDIGKIHEALFDITHERHRLSAAERRAIATHPQRGADVLAPLSAFYPDLPDGVLAHHERWDGTGYPRRLKGRRIPLTARVVAIADTFDAITHGRRYRDPRSAETARDLILQGRATQFDPDLVDLFAFPPVFARILATARTVAQWPPRMRARRRDREQDEDEVPDISFRWRPPRSAARGRPAADRAHRTAR